MPCAAMRAIGRWPTDGDGVKLGISLMGSEPSAVSCALYPRSRCSARCAALRKLRCRQSEDGTRQAGADRARRARGRSEEHTSELQSLMRISYAVFCLKKKNLKTIEK